MSYNFVPHLAPTPELAKVIQGSHWQCSGLGMYAHASTEIGAYMKWTRMMVELDIEELLERRMLWGTHEYAARLNRRM